jgi:arginine decarboxylase
VLADITCDCDGKIDRFIDLHDVKRTLPLHEMNGKDYILGVFLVGAYQETLGDLHNLLGDTNVVSVKLGEPTARWSSRRRSRRHGGRCAVLRGVRRAGHGGNDAPHGRAGGAQRPKISPEERREIMAAYEGGLRGYTYFEK